MLQFRLCSISCGPIDILYAKTCATTKICVVAGYHVVLATLLFQFLMGSVMDINILDQYITPFNSINITTKSIVINTGRLWGRRVLGQSEIVCTVAILHVQSDTAIRGAFKNASARLGSKLHS